MAEELKEVRDEYYCRICKRNFSSEDEHYELMMAEYSDWILDEYNDNNDGPKVFSFLQKKFGLERSQEEQISQPCNMGFCWTEDMFTSQLHVLSTLIEEKDFERVDVVASGILMEIEKLSNFKGLVEKFIVAYLVIQIIFLYLL